MSASTHADTVTGACTYGGSMLPSSLLPKKKETKETKERNKTINLPYSCLLNLWSSMSFAVLSFTARLMLDTIQMLSASLRYDWTMLFLALLSSLTPGASTMTHPVFNISHFFELIFTSLTIGLNIAIRRHQIGASHNDQYTR